MAMPVMGATAVASRVSVRAKSNFHGARVAGVKPVAPRPAAVQTRASARAVEQADDLQLGQVRRWQPPNILAIERDPSCFYRPTRGRGARPIRRRWPVPARTAVPETRSPRRGIARARARSRRARVAVSEFAQTSSTNQRGETADTPNAISIGSHTANPPRPRRDSNTNLTFALPNPSLVSRAHTDRRPHPRGRALPRSSAGECLHNRNLPGRGLGQPGPRVSRDSRTRARLGRVQHFDSRTEPAQ